MLGLQLPPILLGHRDWIAVELRVLRQGSVCSPLPWQTQVCGSCHSCHGSAPAPEHTDFRHTAHRLEKERRKHRIVECVRRHFQAQGKQAGRIAKGVTNPASHLLIKFAAPWPRSTPDTSCRRVDVLVAQETTIEKPDLPQAELSVYALCCLFFF